MSITYKIMWSLILFAHNIHTYSALLRWPSANLKLTGKKIKVELRDIRSCFCVLSLDSWLCCQRTFLWKIKRDSKCGEWEKVCKIFTCLVHFLQSHKNKAATESFFSNSGPLAPWSDVIQINAAKTKMNTEFEIRNSKFEIRKPKAEIRNSKFEMWNIYCERKLLLYTYIS